MRQKLISHKTACFLVLIWWGAFSPPPPLTLIQPKNVLEVPGFSPLCRQEIEKALTGDSQMILHLLKKWGYKTSAIPGAQIPPIYPQSFAAASYLVSLGNPQAVPKGFNDYIPLPLDPIAEIYDTEIAAMKPQYVLVSPYTNPHTLARLKAHQIPYLILPLAQTCEMVVQQIHQLAPSLLPIFIDALNKELTLRLQSFSGPFPLFLQYTGSLEAAHPSLFWDYPEGKLATHIIVATSPDPRIQHLLTLHPVLQKAEKVYWINIRLLHFPTHFGLLGFFDYLSHVSHLPHMLGVKNRTF